MGRVLSRLCLYGTVLDSADTVERSVRSVFRPDADIVITDGGSRDGTYERLLEISKDYNLRVYRAPGSSRGLGRQMALMRCPENSYTAYFDLDDEHNVYFHKSIDWGMATGSPRPLIGHGLREYILPRGAGGTSTMARTPRSGPGWNLITASHSSPQLG
jgi:Glycosyl transferase family 2.